MLAPQPTPDRLAPLRARIDAIDDQLLPLIAARLAVAAEVGRLKVGRPLFRPMREEEVLARVAAGPVPPALAHAVWVQLIVGALAAEGMREIVIEDDALRAPALARFGTVLPIRVDAAALDLATARDVIVITNAPPPPGCARLAPIVDHDGRIVAHVVGPEVTA